MSKQLTDGLPETTRKKRGRTGVPKGYVGIRELSELIGRSPKTIYRMIAEGRLPRSWTFESRLRVWDRKEIQNWLEHAKFAK